MRIVTSKSKASVLKWAKRMNRKVLWQDAKGVWHASVGPNSTPKWAVLTEEIK